MPANLDDDGSSFDFLSLTSNELLWYVLIGAIPFILILVFPGVCRNGLRKAFPESGHQVGFSGHALRGVSAVLFCLSFCLFPALVAAVWKGLDLSPGGFVGGLGRTIAGFAGLGSVYLFYRLSNALEKK